MKSQSLSEFFLVFTDAFVRYLQNWELFPFKPTFGFIFIRVFGDCFQSLLVSRFPGFYLENIPPSVPPDDAWHFPIFHLSASALHSGGNLKLTSRGCSRGFLHFGNSYIAFGMVEWVCVLLTYACVSKPCKRIQNKKCRYGILFGSHSDTLLLNQHSFIFTVSQVFLLLVPARLLHIIEFLWPRRQVEEQGAKKT